MTDEDLYKEYLECICGVPESVMVVTIDKDEYPRDPDLILSVQLNPLPSFLDRLWVGLRFAFTGKTGCGAHWGEVLLTDTSVNKLAKAITSYRMIKKLRAGKRAKDEQREAEALR